MTTTSLFNTGIRPAIDDYLLAEAAKVRNYGEYWSASSAGYCQRKVIFERLGVPPVEKESDGRKQRLFTSGHIFHDWIQGITKEAGLSIASEVELQDEDLMIRGHFDDLVLIEKEVASRHVSGDWRKLANYEPVLTRRLILYDYKTVNSRSFLWAKKNGNVMSYYHKMQLGTYMYMLRKEGEAWNQKPSVRADPDNPWTGKSDYANLTEARILKIEKDTLMMGEQQLLWDTQLESDVLAYWNSLNAHWQAKTLPQCSCADHENGFMAKEQYNPFFYEGQPCSIELYKQWKADNEKSPTS